MKTDLIVGMATGYTWQQLQPFVISLRRTGYKGRCILLFGDGPKDCVGDAPGYEPGAYAAKRWIHPVDASGDSNAMATKLSQYGVETRNIGAFTYHPIIDRGYRVAGILDELKGTLRYVLSVDTKDIVFQSDPTVWLQNNLGNSELVVVSEGMRYKENVGNKRNAYEAFGMDAYESLAEQEVLNAGVIAGCPDAVRNLSIDINELASKDLRFATFTPAYKDMIADQTAMNLLLRTEKYCNLILIARAKDGFVSEFHHMHYTVMPDGSMKEQKELQEAVRGGRPDWPRSEYSVFMDGVIYPGGSDRPFAIFHQYVINGDWWVAVKEKYEERS